MQASLEFGNGFLDHICHNADHKEATRLHFERIHLAYVKEVTELLQSDEDLAKENVVEAQETAGFHEPPQRLAIGGHFNHLLLWSVKSS